MSYYGRRIEECPLGGWCNSKNVVYQACISPMEHNNDGERIYTGISAGNWKQGLYNHRHSFSNPRLRNQFALSKYFWTLKDQGLTPKVKWKTVRQFSTANSFNGRYNLCIGEKISIINFKDHRLLLIERNELVFKCRHKSKFRSSWLGATEAPTLDNNKDTDAGWFLLEIITSISVDNSIIWRWDLCREGYSWNFEINSQLGFF